METPLAPVPPVTRPRRGQRAREVVHGFKDFIHQYGVAPLAIGVVIGTAVNDLVKSVVDGLITPLISLFSPETALQNLQFQIGSSVFKMGQVLNSVLSFAIIALLVYMIAKIILRNDSLLEKK